MPGSHTWRRLVLVAACGVLLGVVSGTGAAVAQAAPEGDVRFMKRTAPEFDSYMTRAHPRFRTWMRSSFWRSVVFTPYFDDKTAWYRNSWVYFDLYAIYRGSTLAQRRPRWILRGADGERRYIPWDCARGTCPQYAADVGNPTFRRWWIAEAKRRLAEGYRGIWIDDVNMEFRVADGSGEERPPIDPRTRQAMTEAAWRAYVATFVSEIRRALPGVELVHNAIWYAADPERTAHPDVGRQIAASDWVNLEHGVGDPGLTGGDGPFSVRTFLDQVDRIHAHGSGVVLEGDDPSPAGREYALAGWLLVSSGRDAIGLGSVTPRNWWRGYDLRLGAALGRRYDWQGLLRRDFDRGTVLLNEPDAPERTVALDRPMRTLAGRTVSSVTLGPREGVVLVGVPRALTSHVLLCPSKHPPGLSAEPEAPPAGIITGGPC